MPEIRNPLIGKTSPTPVVAAPVVSTPAKITLPTLQNRSTKPSRPPIQAAAYEPWRIDALGDFGARSPVIEIADGPTDCNSCGTTAGLVAGDAVLTFNRDRYRVTCCPGCLVDITRRVSAPPISRKITNPLSP